MSLLDDDDQDAETFAVLLLPGWKHRRTGKIHIRRDCRAVQFHADLMAPILIRMDDQGELSRILDRCEVCGYCFPGELH
jgi:hypothetical protein